MKDTKTGQKTTRYSPDKRSIENPEFSGGLDNIKHDFILGVDAAIAEYAANEQFRELVDTGGFLFVDGYFVLNDPKYVEQTPHETPRLSDYAKSHTDECCAKFNKHINQSGTPLEKGFTGKTVSDDERTPTFHKYAHNVELLTKAKDLAALKANASEFKDFCSKTANHNFAQTAFSHIERLGLSQVSFSAKTLLDDRQYRKIKAGDMSKVSFDTVMAICIGLDLGLEYGEPLLNKAGYSLDGDDRFLHKMLLAFYRGRTIFDCNEYLVEQGEKPLREKEYKDFTGQK